MCNYSIWFCKQRRLQFSQNPGTYFWNPDLISTTIRVQFFQNPDIIFLNPGWIFFKTRVKVLLFELVLDSTQVSTHKIRAQKFKFKIVNGNTRISELRGPGFDDRTRTRVYIINPGFESPKNQPGRKCSSLPPQLCIYAFQVSSIILLLKFNFMLRKK